MKRILLVGAGHAHAVLLASLAEKPLFGASITLVSPNARQIYSAMLPGVIAGHYRLEQAQFDVAMLAELAYAEFVESSLRRFDVTARRAVLQDFREVSYDLVSFNVGSVTDTSVPGSAEHALPVKPFEGLVKNLRRASHVAVAGGGAAGAELAMAIRHRGTEATLYAERDPFPEKLAWRVARALRRRKVDYRPGMRVDAVEPGPVAVAGSSRQAFDLVLWATGPAPLPWLRSSGLALDEHGFVKVDATLRSVSHPEVLAVGDCAALGEAKSGVHAVRQGATLSINLRNLVEGKPLVAYQPEPKALLLLSCGSRYAIATRGAWSAEGRWAWWWKNWIDRRWLRRLDAPKRPAR